MLQLQLSDQQFYCRRCNLYQRFNDMSIAWLQMPWLLMLDTSIHWEQLQLSVHHFSLAMPLHAYQWWHLAWRTLHPWWRHEHTHDRLGENRCTQWWNNPASWNKHTWKYLKRCSFAKHLCLMNWHLTNLLSIKLPVALKSEICSVNTVMSNTDISGGLIQNHFTSRNLRLFHSPLAQLRQAFACC